MSDNHLGWCVMAPDKTVFLGERYAYLDSALLAAERMRRRYGAGYRVVEVVWREVAPAEEPREVVEPKSAVGLAVEELQRRQVVADLAPAPARYRCEECCQDIPASEVYAGTHFRQDPKTGCRWPCGPVATMVEPAPAPVRYRCEGCGWEGEAGDLATSDGHIAIVQDANGDPEPNLCGPCVPITGAADGEAG